MQLQSNIRNKPLELAKRVILLLRVTDNRSAHGYMIRVRKFNLGWYFFPSKVSFSWPSVDRFGKKFWGLMTLGQFRSVPNFFSFGSQRAEKHNI